MKTKLCLTNRDLFALLLLLVATIRVNFNLTCTNCINTLTNTYISYHPHT